MKTNLVTIALGTNLGNRLLNLRNATTLIKERFFSDLKESIILEVEALLPPGAPLDWNKPYLNMILSGHTTASPEDLLSGLKEIEHQLGRPDTYERWSPRIIDLDILLWGNKIINTPPLQIPHPELFKRPFLLHLLALLDAHLVYEPEDGTFYSGKTFGEIAHQLSYGSTTVQGFFTRSFVLDPQLVGVINITPDSMSDGGLYFQPDRAISRALELVADGASVIDLGAQSTNFMGRDLLSPEEEYGRLHPVLEGLSDLIKTHNIQISIDTFSPPVILKALERYPISWINDVTGKLDKDTSKIIAQSGCKIVSMHSVEIPATKVRVIPFESHPPDVILDWGRKTQDRLLSCGFSPDHIILDPGIGFGKSAYQDLALLRCAKKLKSLGSEILVGHSRKYYLSAFYPSQPAERDLETIAVSDALATAGVNYLRVHNVRDHQRVMVAKHVLKG